MGLKDEAKATGQLVAKQSQRMMLTKQTLPNAHFSLGQHVYDSGEHRQEYAEIYKRIDDATEEIKSIEEHSHDHPKAEGLAAKAKLVAEGAKDKVNTEILRHKVNAALTELGKTVYESLGEQAGPTELVHPISEAMENVKQLDEEMGTLSETAKGQRISLKRIGIGAVLAVIIAPATIVLFLALFGGSTRPTREINLHGFGEDDSLVKLTFDYLELFYKAPVTETEANRLGRFLVDSGWDDMAGGDWIGHQQVKIAKSGDTYEYFQLLPTTLKPGAKQDYDNAVKELSESISINVFDHAPVNIHICDGNFQTIRVVNPHRN